MSARVDYLVTGDKRILAVQGYAGVKIVMSRDFYDLLISQGGPEITLPDAPD